MRIFIVSALALVCIACGPNTCLPKDYPSAYLRSKIEWGAFSTLVYQLDQLDTLLIPLDISKDKLELRLRNQPCYEIEKIQFNNEEQASLQLAGSQHLSDLHYQEIAGYLHLWFIHNLDEQYYFQLKPGETSLCRAFYFYWKKESISSSPQIYFRVEAGIDFSFDQFIGSQLVYDNFLENGDTLQVIKGFITYQKE